MEPFESLGLQAFVSFTSSLVGMAVYMYMFCPNHRCCHTTEVRALLECKKKVKSLESDNENR